jgi:putative exosortase-associated protein (TIGR04073 family)
MMTAISLGSDQFKAPESSTPQEVVGAMSHKLVRGIANTATGWVEFPKQIYLTYRDEGPAAGIFVGPFKGIGMTVARTVTGVGEAITFFIPYPGFFEPYFEPTYVWQKE